jgi:hypothetical protein
VVAILVAAAAPEHQQDVLSTFLVVQCLYIAYKVLFRPYLHWVTFTFKLIGDLFFAVS